MHVGFVCQIFVEISTGSGCSQSVWGDVVIPRLPTNEAPPQTKVTLHLGVSR